MQTSAGPCKCIHIQIDGTVKYQTIDGFGVNINSKYWDNGNLIPVMDLLREDLGATIYRLDAWGKSNWVDPEDKLDAGILKNREALMKIYGGIHFQNAKAMGKYLNDHGIDPYITLSGIVPKWMCAGDGKTLARYDEFAEMAASYVEWAERDAGIRFTLFGPLNETDIGPPEGPMVSPSEYAKVCEALVDALDRHGLGHIRLVVAEQAHYNLDFTKHLVASKKVLSRIAVIGMHAYSDFHSKDLVELVKGSTTGASVWMTEYGDLDESGEREWYVAWVSYQRLMRLLEDGMNGAMNWDAYDNYHDHDEAWTIYGLIRNSRKIYTPKKRYYSTKQMYRFVRPGFVRIEAVSPCEGVKVLAFMSPHSSEVTVTGMNETGEDIYLNIHVKGLGENVAIKTADIYRTTVEESCARVATVSVTADNYPYTGIDMVAPAHSIFTATTVK